MALSDPKQQLELIAAKTERAVDMGPRILREIKSSILFQYNWEELLMSGPVSISCLGACFVAAASPKANVIFSPPSTGRFAALIDLDGEYGLKANLVECANLGNSAFIVAEDGMNVINMTSENVYNIVDDIMITLESPQDAKILLPQQLATLGESATTCYEAARKIDLKFEKWLDHVRELHVACIATQTSTSDKLIANDIERATTQISIDYQKVTVAQLEKTTKKLEEQLDVTTEAYKKASDGFPTGWDLLGQQIVGQLADSLTTALNQAIPALVDNLNPIAKAKAVAGLASGLIHGNEKEKANEAPSTNGNADAPAADRHISSPAATRPKDADDPAYNQAARDLPFFELVNGTFVGDDGGIDWDKAKGEPGKANQSIVFAAKMLQSSKTAFESLATSAEPSKTYSGALATACEIANGIKGELDKAKDIKYTLPSKESTTVQKWQSDFTSAFVALTGLISRAKSFPGSPAGGAGIASGVDPAVQTAQINAKTAQSQMLLDAGKNRLTTTQAALVATQETYQKSTELLTQQQNRFAELNANLERLKSTNMKLSEIKAVLVQCIMLVVNLKAQITNLVRFFKAIATTVEFVLNKQVKPFITTIKAITSDGVDPNEEFKVGQYTMTDLQRSAIFNSTLTIRAYYSVFGDIAQMWMDMSQSSIFPGLRMLDELSALDVEKDKAAMQKKAAELQRWSQKASDDVFAAAKKKQDKVLGGMKSRVATIANTTHYLPPPPKKVQQAIENGVEHSKLAAEKGIEKQVEGSLVGKFSGKRLPRGDDD